MMVTRQPYFNSRPREGGDSSTTLVSTATAISIRAPVRGATDRRATLFDMSKFQFAPPRGGRPIVSRTEVSQKNFNSRPREGGDQGDRPLHPQHPDFNARPREGGDRDLDAGDRDI